MGSPHVKFLTLAVLADLVANFSKNFCASFEGGWWDLGAFGRFGVSRREHKKDSREPTLPYTCESPTT